MNMNQVLSPQEIQQYKSQGYTDGDIQQALNDAEKEANDPLNQSYSQAMNIQDPRANASQSIVKGGVNDNLIVWQLELDSILERIEHMLRGDRPTWENGSVIWKPAQFNSEKIMTDFGVSEIMRVLSNYVNRNTILSNYKEEVINEKMLDLGNELADLIYLKYEILFATMTFKDCKAELILNGEITEEMTEEHKKAVEKLMKTYSLEKRKLYPIIVRELVDVVHSSYLRALHGGERESLRESRQVSQTEAINGSGININNMQPRQERGLLNPMRWLGGKFK